MTILSIEHLTVSYRTGVAVKDFSADLSEGECLSVMGPSGAGKSSVLRAIAGLLKADRGKIFLDGKDITDAPPHARSMAMVFQNSALFPHTKIKDNITYGMTKLGCSKAEIETKLAAIAEKMKISDQLNKYPGACSGGQRQRAGIARALIRNPRILLLDEPLNSLDLNMKEELLEEIRRLSREEKMTMIYVTHDRHEAETAADRIALLNEGRLLAVSDFRSLSEAPATLEIAGLLGNEYQLHPCTAADGRLIGKNGEVLEEAAVADGAYVIAWRNRPGQKKSHFLLYEAGSGARVL